MADNLKAKRITISTPDNIQPKLNDGNSLNESIKMRSKSKLIDDDLYNKELDYAKIIENSIEKRFEKLNKFDEKKFRKMDMKNDELSSQRNETLDLICVKPRMINTQWAISKINTFDDNSKTFEIIENLDDKNSTGKKIGRTEIMFAVLPNGATICYTTV